MTMTSPAGSEKRDTVGNSAIPRALRLPSLQSVGCSTRYSKAIRGTIISRRRKPKNQSQISQPLRHSTLLVSANLPAFARPAQQKPGTKTAESFQATMNDSK
jgi:hypothetical protein